MSENIKDTTPLPEGEDSPSPFGGDAEDNPTSLEESIPGVSPIGEEDEDEFLPDGDEADVDGDDVDPAEADPLTPQPDESTRDANAFPRTSGLS